MAKLLTGCSLRGWRHEHRLGGIQSAGIRCGSRKVFDHSRLLSGAAHCSLDNCYVFSQSDLKARPPTPRPEPEKPVPVETPAPVAPTPAPARPVEHCSPEYRRYYLSCLHWKYPKEKIAMWDVFKRLQYEKQYEKEFENVMKNVEASEAELLGE